MSTHTVPASELARLDTRALESQAPRLAPWEAEPFRLWSLWDFMLRFENAAFVTAWGEFNRDFSRFLADPGPEARDSLLAALGGLEHEVARAGLPLTLPTLEQFRLLRLDLVGRLTRESIAGAAAQGRSLVNCVLLDLTQCCFLVIPPRRKALYNQLSPPFGESVDRAFSAARFDVAAAARCLALGEWTASVFHCMRVLECGLAPLAIRFNVSFDKNSWHPILGRIERAIQELRDRPRAQRTGKDDQDIANYSEAAIQFRHFKDAWRNHVSHTGAPYGEAQAEEVYRSVRGFMQKMAAIVGDDAGGE